MPSEVGIAALPDLRSSQHSVNDLDRRESLLKRALEAEGGPEHDVPATTNGTPPATVDGGTPPKRARLDTESDAIPRFCNEYYCNVEDCRVHDFPDTGGGHEDGEYDDDFGEHYDDGDIDTNPHDWKHENGIHVQWFSEQIKRMDRRCKQARSGRAR